MEHYSASRALEAFRFNDSTMIFSTAPKSHEAVGWDATIDVVLEEEWRREKLRYNHATLKQGLLDLGFEDHVAHSDRQILTIVTGRRKHYTELSTHARRAASLVRSSARRLRKRARILCDSRCMRPLTEIDLERFLDCMRDLRYVLRSEGT